MDSLEETIIRMFHPLELQNIEGTMKVLRPRVGEIREDGWSKLEKVRSFLQETEKLAKTEYKELSNMPKIKNQAKYYSLLKLKKEQYVDHINNVSKDLEHWFGKKQERNKDYTLIEIGLEGEERGVEKTPEEILKEIRVLLNQAKHLFENFKSGRFEVYRELEEHC